MSDDVVLTRHDSSDHGTFGRLIARGVSFFSGELPWLGNASNVSCIPTGRYRWVWTWSTHFNRSMYLALATDPRAGIREHSANLMGDRAKGFRAQLNGCVALGEKLGMMDGQKALLVSAPAVRRFEQLMQQQPFWMEIRDG